MGLRLFFIRGKFKGKKCKRKKVKKKNKRKEKKIKLDSKLMNYSLYKFPAQFTSYK